MVERQDVLADHVDVGLRELAEAPFLRPLTAPGPLDLVAAERELEVSRVLQHVAGQRDGEVEVQTELAGPVRVALGVAALQPDVALLDLSMPRSRGGET